jgi:hypothetical protein
VLCEWNAPLERAIGTIQKTVSWITRNPKASEVMR